MVEQQGGVASPMTEPLSLLWQQQQEEEEERRSRRNSSSSSSQASSRRDSGDAKLYNLIRRRRRIAKTVTRWLYIALATFLVAVVMPWTIYFLASNNAELRSFLLPITLTFFIVSVPISLWGIAGHVTNYWQPVLQRYVVRILWMVPVYSLTSLIELTLWLRVERGSVRAERWVVTPSAIRACYEAYTVLNFFYFLVTFLEVHYAESAERVMSHIGETTISTFEIEEDDDEEVKMEVKHPCPPYRCLVEPWRLDDGEFLRCCKFGVLLYTTVMPLCALVTMFDSLFMDTDDSPSITPDAASLLASPSAWAAAIQFNLSNHAIYCLGLFFYTAHELLAPCAPHAKFLAVKGIVFGTFFQDLGIEAVFYLNPSLASTFGDSSSSSKAALGALKCTLLSVEMLGFALLHAYAFPVSAFPRVYQRPDDEEEDWETKSDDSEEEDLRPRVSLAWQAAWGDYYADQRWDSRMWRARGRIPGSRPRDGLDYSQVIFDVRDVHQDTTNTLRRIGNNVVELPQRNSFIRRIQRWQRNITLRKIVTQATLRHRSSTTLPNHSSSSSSNDLHTAPPSEGIPAPAPPAPPPPSPPSSSGMETPLI